MSPASGWPFLRIAHRGAAGLEPENTLRAIERALRLGVEMVELDVRPCSDGTLMVVHDATLERVAGDPRAVAHLSVAALQQVNVGKGERVPTLEEALALLKGRALVNLDQKADGLASQVIAAIDRAGNREETMLSGFAPRTFAAMQQRAPEVHLALSIDAQRSQAGWILLSRRWAPAARGLASRIIARARALGMAGVTLQYHLAAPQVVPVCQRAGLHVLTWTVDDLHTMRQLRASGVDGITSNRPDLLMQLG